MGKCLHRSGIFPIGRKYPQPGKALRGVLLEFWQ
jgi:hypothetical protein